MFVWFNDDCHLFQKNFQQRHITPILEATALNSYMNLCFAPLLDIVLLCRQKKKRGTLLSASETRLAVAAMHAIAFVGGRTNPVEIAQEVAKVISQSEPKNSGLCFRLVSEVYDWHISTEAESQIQHLN